MIEFLKIGEVKSPERKRGNAGIDLFVPTMTDEWKEAFVALNEGKTATTSKTLLEMPVESRYIEIPPMGDVLIPSRLCARIPEDEALEVKNKSGVAVKMKLVVGACVVDSSYEGEILIDLFNMNKFYVYLKAGQKIVQAVPMKIDTDEHRVHEMGEVTKEELYAGHTKVRGEGCLGSTGV